MNDNKPGPASLLRAILKSSEPDSAEKSPPARRRSRKVNGSVSDFIVSGNGNIVANQVTLNHSPRPVRPKAVPGDAHITQLQARALKELVDSIVEVGASVKNRKPTFASVYGALTKKMGVTSYHFIARDQYPDALAFLTTMRGRITSMRCAPQRLGPGFRNQALRFIHARCREFPDGQSRREAYMMGTFGTASLSELADADLAQLRKHILGWRHRL